MHAITLRKLPLRATLLLIIIFLLAFAVGSSPTWAQENEGNLEKERTLENNDIGLVNPASIAYSQRTELLLVAMLLVLM